MGWLTKILKGSTHKVREGQYHGRFEEDEIVEEASHADAASAVSSVRDVGSDFDIEEIDLAIALSIAEQEEKELEKGKRVIENENLLEEDELIARALQESLNVESPPRSTPPETPSPSSPRTPSTHSPQTPSPRSPQSPPPPRLPQSPPPRRLPRSPPPPRLPQSPPPALLPQTPPPSRLPQIPVTGLPRYNYGSSFIPPLYHPSSHRICAGCNSDIGQGRYLNCMGSVWHPDCFCCHSCGLPISEIEFSMSDNHPFHKTCYKDLHHPKCDVCKNFIPTNGAGLIEYRAHPFWHQKYCPAHESDGTPRCCSCERMEQVDARYLNLDDGRKLCLECLDSSIMDTHECQPLYLEIREFYEGLNMKVEQQIPLLLVERQALNEAMEGEKTGHHHMAETRGLCLSEEQTVSTILRRPRIWGDRIIDMFTEPYRLVRKCEVTAILILYGLPRLLTGSILAHELMHAWLRLQGYPNLSPDVEEGICQVLAHMWLDSEIIAGSSSSSNATLASSSSSLATSSSTSTSGSSKKGKRSDFEKKLGEFFEHQIESDTSAAYGDGFREGNKAVEKYGLRRTLDHIRYTGSFPE